jgi:Fur family ferric uptake transcriptional regulator
MLSLSNAEIFNKYNIKNTKNRNIILDILREGEFLTAEEIFLKVRELDKSLNLSTVYRTLNTFEAKGIVIKSNIVQDDKTRFKLNNANHMHYLICLSCNKKIELENCPIIGYDSFLEESTDFDIVGHKLELYGYCPKCRNGKTRI